MSSLRSTSIACLLCFTAGAGAMWAQQKAQGTSRREPQFENEHLTVWKSIIMPGQPLTLHRHDHGRALVALNDGRLRVTDKNGKFIKEFPLAVNTGIGGAPGGVGFSPDKQQQYLFISDLTNNHIWFLNRADGKIVGQLGSMGDNGGQFYGLHMIAVDSTGNIYTGEVFAGERVQRFVPANSARGKLLSQLATMK